MKKFADYKPTETLIVEMPHIPLDNANPIDLELEVHSNMDPDDYVQYFRDWIEGKEIESKQPNFSQRLPKRARSEFADAILNQWQYTKLFTIKHYGQRTWSRIEKMLSKYL